jgi:D-serine deaminase-like pyridoxal phosphate-dependent protein
MDRTGAPMNVDGVLGLIETIRRARLEFRGLHYYDGQLGNIELEERTKRAHAGYDRLLELVDKLEQAGHAVGEVITAGTPTLPCSIAYRGFSGRNFLHRVSPGTVVYSDATSLAQLPEYAYKPAAVVLTRVVSHPRPGVVTCDAGHKSVAADAGVPTCVVLGHPELRPLTPSEEHLPMAVETGAQAPEIGEVLLLVPRHVCPTINNFDHALLVERGNIREVAPVSARGREAPLLKGVSAAR